MLVLLFPKVITIKKIKILISKSDLQNDLQLAFVNVILRSGMKNI